MNQESVYGSTAIHTLNSFNSTFTSAFYHLILLSINTPAFPFLQFITGLPIGSFLIASSPMSLFHNYLTVIPTEPIPLTFTASSPVITLFSPSHKFHHHKQFLRLMQYTFTFLHLFTSFQSNLLICYSGVYILHSLLHSLLYFERFGFSQTLFLINQLL